MLLGTAIGAGEMRPGLLAGDAVRQEVPAMIPVYRLGMPHYTHLHAPAGRYPPCPAPFSQRGNRGGSLSSL